MSIVMIWCVACDSKYTGVKPNAKLGEVSLEVTGDPAAQKHFKNGLLLLHSFEYLDARSEFIQAQKIDKSFAMAYWGELMAYNHPIWKRQLTDRATAALIKMAPTKETRRKMLKTEIEKDFFESVEILYGKGTKRERDLAYMNYMKKMYEKYPNNHEVSAFYAISLLGSSASGRDDELFDRSAQIAKGILEENAKHPGALHYLIHSYDDPDHAHMAVEAADSYAQVAPDAAHALHMPSHIYVALGRWRDVVKSNIASWNASVKKKQAGKSMEGSYHALNWLQYGFLQRGESEKAEALVEKLIAYTEEVPSKTAVSYLLAMQGAQCVETDTWTGEIADLDIDVSKLNLIKRSQDAFLKGMKYAKSGQIEKLENLIRDFKKDIYKSSLDVGNESYAMCSSGEYSSVAASQLDVDMATIMSMELEAELLKLKGKHDEALEKLSKASDLDETLKYAFGPPFIFKPAQEAYADYLRAQGQYQFAFEAYLRSLKRHPKRLHSLKGKLEMAKALKLEEDVVTAYEQDVLSVTEPLTWNQIL